MSAFIFIVNLARQVLHELEQSQLSNDLEAFENLTKSYTTVLQKQDTMLVAAFGLLLNISAELKNETRIINKGMYISMGDSFKFIVKQKISWFILSYLHIRLVRLALIKQ